MSGGVRTQRNLGDNIVFYQTKPERRYLKWAGKRAVWGLASYPSNFHGNGSRANRSLWNKGHYRWWGKAGRVGTGRAGKKISDLESLELCEFRKEREKKNMGRRTIRKKKKANRTEELSPVWEENNFSGTSEKGMGSEQDCKKDGDLDLGLWSRRR